MYLGSKERSIVKITDTIKTWVSTHKLAVIKPMFAMAKSIS